MRTLDYALEHMENQGGCARSLKKHLKAVDIYNWEDFNRESLYDLKDSLLESCAPSTARTNLNWLKVLLHRYEDCVDLPEGWEKIIRVSRVAKPMKVYLTEEELYRVEKTRAGSDRREFVKSVFLVCAYTGLRVSDAMGLTLANVVNGNLHYVAQKTGKGASIPLKTGLDARIAWIAEHQDCRVTLMSYNRAIREICKKAGITERVTVLKGGKELKGPKWQFVSSHTARISTASNLAKRGVPIGDISNLLQHSGISMTERYVVRDHVQLSSDAMQFFR